jgi:hypothetical protein
MLDGTVNALGRYPNMTEERAEHYRREAENCLEQAELAPDELMKSRMRFLADQWLKLAASAALVDAA